MGLPDHAAEFRVRSGPWSAPEIGEFLRDTVIPIRLATNGRFPLVQSVWFCLRDGDLWCATQGESVLARRIRRDPHVGFEVSADAPPYLWVRGTGIAHLVPGHADSVLPELLSRYGIETTSPLATWLLSRLDTEVAVRISELVVTSWDYRARM